MKKKIYFKDNFYEKKIVQYGFFFLFCKGTLELLRRGSTSEAYFHLIIIGIVTVPHYHQDYVRQSGRTTFVLHSNLHNFILSFGSVFFFFVLQEKVTLLNKEKRKKIKVKNIINFFVFSNKNILVKSLLHKSSYFCNSRKKKSFQ